MAPTTADSPNGRRNMQYESDYEKSVTQVDNQGELDNLVCDTTRSRDRNIAEDAEFNRIGLHNIDYAWGMSISGVLIWQGLSYEGVDPFYPTVYGSVYDPTTVQQTVDTCSLKTEISGYFQYYTAATCAGDSTYEDDDVEKMAEGADLFEMIRDAWVQNHTLRYLDYQKTEDRYLAPTMVMEKSTAIVTSMSATVEL